MVVNRAEKSIHRVLITLSFKHVLGVIEAEECVEDEKKHNWW